MNTVADWRGTPIKVGSIVVYPGRQSSSVWVTEGIVESIEVGGEDDDELKIGVRKTRQSYYGVGEFTNSRIAYPKIDRITVID